MDSYSTNGNQSSSSQSHSQHPNAGSTAAPGSLPPLSLSILGIEPLDEFIKEVADFVYHMITVVSLKHPPGKIEVEAKVGLLRDRVSAKRLELPVLVETSACLSLRTYALAILTHLNLRLWWWWWWWWQQVLQPDAFDIRFESNMSVVCPSHISLLLPTPHMRGEKLQLSAD
jgi:hypothetical protein